ncbi:MAG: hypothetical protein LBF75_03175 [Treponema sp.]|jgi:hypothetical protein|nr:hypothetical protein [Treponema sp.]
MKKKLTPHGITAGAFAVFIVLGLACAGAPASKWEGVVYTGEDTRLLEGTTWTYIGGSATYTWEFRAGGKLTVRGSSLNNTWKREGNTVYMTVNDGYSRSIGTYYPETQKIMGSTEDSLGQKWDFTMELVSGSSALSGARAGAASSPPSSTAYVVTVWYTSSGTRLSSVYSVQAASKDEAEREAERVWKTQFGWNQAMQFQEAVSY